MEPSTFELLVVAPKVSEVEFEDSLWFLDGHGGLLLEEKETRKRGNTIECRKSITVYWL